MKKFSNKSFFLLIIFLASSFSLFADHHHRNNFRLEKRHYRKGFYFDCWTHPKTYPRTYSTPETREPVQPADKVEQTPNVPTQTNDSISKVEINIDVPVDNGSVDNGSIDNGTPERIISEPDRNITPVQIDQDVDTDKSVQRVSTPKIKPPTKISVSNMVPVVAPVPINKSKVPQAVAPTSNPQSTSAPVTNESPVDILVPVPNN